MTSDDSRCPWRPYLEPKRPLPHDSGLSGGGGRCGHAALPREGSVFCRRAWAPRPPCSLVSGAPVSRSSRGRGIRLAVGWRAWTEGEGSAPGTLPRLLSVHFVPLECPLPALGPVPKNLGHRSLFFFRSQLFFLKVYFFIGERDHARSGRSRGRVQADSLRSAEPRGARSHRPEIRPS